MMDASKAQRGRCRVFLFGCLLLALAASYFGGMTYAPLPASDEGTAASVLAEAQPPCCCAAQQHHEEEGEGHPCKLGCHTAAVKEIELASCAGACSRAL